VELALGDYAGVLNVAGAEALSRHDLGVRVARRHGLPAGSVPAATLAASGLARPGVIRMDSSRLATLFPDLPELRLPW
jgi:dTDP-4-dehydrorhamnose reductase